MHDMNERSSYCLHSPGLPTSLLGGKLKLHLIFFTSYIFKQAGVITFQASLLVINLNEQDIGSN
jgi:hypothetical protein